MFIRSERAGYAPALQAGWLIIRVGFGILYVIHGGPKVFGGPEAWQELGATMELLGIGFWHGFWGFMAGMAEFLGGLLLILGLFTRPAAALMLLTMVVATISHIVAGDPFSDYSHPIKAGIVFLAILMAGAGPMSLDVSLLEARRVRRAYR